MKTTFNKTGVNKMKSFTSALLVMLIVAAMFSFPMTASAADLGKEPKTKEQLAARTASEIRQDIMDTYNIDVDVYDLNLDGQAGKTTMADLENTFSLIGRSTIRKISAHSKNTGEETDFIFEASVNAGMTYGLGNANSVIVVSNSSNIDKKVLLHEFGHTIDAGVLKDKGNSTLKAIADRHGKAYLTKNGTSLNSQNSKEDFARLFDNMVYSGGAATFKDGNYSEYSIVSKEIEKEAYTAIYNLLLDEFGTGATCVKRSAAFLGIELPTK